MTQLYTDRDERPLRIKPLASDILLSFWKHIVGWQHVRTLSGIIFQTVEERTVRDAKRQVYHNLGAHRSDTVELHHSTDGPLFNIVHRDTKLGRCARTIAKEYIEMKEGLARVSGFRFIPQGNSRDHRRDDFHLEVILEYDR